MVNFQICSSRYRTNCDFSGSVHVRTLGFFFFFLMQFSSLEIVMYYSQRVNFQSLTLPVSSVAVEQTLTSLMTGVTFPYCRSLSTVCHVSAI